MSDVSENLDIANDALGLIDLGDLIGTDPALAMHLAVVRDVIAKAKTIEAALELQLVDQMESDDIRVPGLGWLHRRPKKMSTAGSNWDGARRAGKREIARMVSVEQASGELRPDYVNVAHEAMDLMAKAFSIGSPLKGFRTNLGLDPDEFITYTATGYTVEIGESTDE